jgi:hypothetical protein
MSSIVTSSRHQQISGGNQHDIDRRLPLGDAERRRRGVRHAVTNPVIGSTLDTHECHV